jgi:hypothetical protein
MHRRVVAGREDAGAFHHHIEAAPIKLGGVAHGRHAHRAAASVDPALARLHLEGQPAVHAVEAQEMGVRLDRAEIVDRHHLDVAPPGFEDRAQNVPPDPPEAVDPDPDCHACLRHAESVAAP